VISQVRLGAYNGLHVALRARDVGIPAVVIGTPDAVLERDAQELGATFVKSGELERDRLMGLVQALLACRTTLAAGPRPPGPLPAPSRGEEKQQDGEPEGWAALLPDAGSPRYKFHSQQHLARTVVSVWPPRPGADPCGESPERGRLPADVRS